MELGLWERRPLLQTKSEEDHCAGESHGGCEDHPMFAYHWRHSLSKKMKKVIEEKERFWFEFGGKMVMNVVKVCEE